MRVLAAVRIRAELSRAAAALAEPLGLTVYDAAVRLGASLPRVLATLPRESSPRVASAPFRARFEEDPGERLLRACAAAGVDAVLFDERDVVDDARRLRARALRLDDDALHVEGGDRRGLRLPWSSLRLVLRAMHRRGDVPRPASPPPRGAVRGLFELRVLPPKDTRAEPAADHEAAVHLYFVDHPPVVVRDGVDFGFLGAAMRATRFENLATLHDELRRRAAHATFDDRMLRVGAREQSLAAGFAQPLSPHGTFDLAAHALDLAARRGLLGAR